MGNLSLDPNEAPSLPGLADHYLCLTPAETVAYLGEPASRSLPGRPVGVAEYGADPKSPVLESLIARLTIAEQHHSLGIGNPKLQRSRPCPILARNSVLQDLKDGFPGSD